MPTEQIKGKVPLIGATIVFVVAVVVLPYQMLKLESQQKELDKREKWMNNVQELLLESIESRFGVSEMEAWQKEFVRINNLKSAYIPVRNFSVKPVLPKDQ